MKPVYKIIGVYACFAKSLLPNGILNRYVISNFLAEYFDEYTAYETHNKWNAVRKFAECYHDTHINPNAYDFQDSVDCVSVEFFQLVRMDNGSLADILFESDFPCIVIE